MPLSKKWSAVLAALLLVGCNSMAATEPNSKTAVTLAVGTYTQDGSEGIYTLTYDSRAARFGPLKLAAPAQNASFLWPVDSELLLAVSEVGKGKLVSYRRADGQLQPLAEVLTGGASPCYVAVHPEGSFAATANYMGGNVSVFKLRPDGTLADLPQLLQHQGKGPNRDRQEAPHAHWVQWHPTGERLYAVDLGIDQVRVYDFDRGQGASNGRTALALKPGDGPRHLAFHPSLPLAYVVNELSNTLVVVALNPDGTLSERQRLSTLPADFTRHSQVAHLALSRTGEHLYVSNRGHNSIAVFALNAEGEARLLEIEPTRGDWPRHFSLLEDARSLIVANQESGNLVAFRIAADGRLTPAGAEAKVAQPTYVGPLP